MQEPLHRRVEIPESSRNENGRDEALGAIALRSVRESRQRRRGSRS